MQRRNGSVDKKKRSVLYDDENPDKEDNLDVQLLKEREAQQLDGLKKDVKEFKNTVRDISDAISKSRSLLDDVNSEMGNTQGGIGLSLEKLKHLAKEATTTHMWYLIFFMVAVFLILFFFLRK